MSVNPTYRQCWIVWIGLVGLLLVAVAVSRLQLPAGIVALLIFGTAVVKALLVALYYMHLRFQHFAVSLMALTPVLLFLILTLALFPDFVFHR